MPTSRALRAALAAGAIATAASVAPAAAQATQQPRPLAALSFMAGCWRGDAGVDRSIEEHWTNADSDVMLATTRYLDDNTGRTRGWEFSRVAVDSAGTFLLPAPGGNQQGRFRLAASATAGEARFEDPSHDFPKRIIYRALDANRLVVRIDGGEGAQQAQEWRLQRVACPGTAR